MSLTLTPTEAVRPLEAAPQPSPVAAPSSSGIPPLGLIADLAHGLTAYAVAACQWKGHWKPQRWGTGVGDIDLLVGPDAAPDLAWLLRRLGFKEGVATEGVPGMASFFGLDRETGRLVHVHVHHRLLMGRMWATYYRVPIEQGVLASSRRSPFFRTPAPELELLLLALDQSLRRSPLDVLLGRGADRAAAAWPALQRLQEQSSPATLERQLSELLPAVDANLLARCVAALGPDASAWSAFRVNRALRKSLAPYEVSRALTTRRLRRRSGASRKLAATGGSVIALDGTDGSGKSTAAMALRDWLGTAFATTHAHFGRPPRTLMTMAAGAALKAGRVLGVKRLLSHLELARCVATARDRFHLYKRVRRFAAAGGLAICERYPNAGNRELAGPSTAQGVAAGVDTALARWLRRVEARFYERITAPDVLLVLCVDPDTAVRRKTTEPADYVRARAVAMARAPWDLTRARLIDAGRPFADVLSELKSRIWEAL